MDTAIREWFLDRDPFAIHMLVCASYFVLTDIGKDNGKAPPIMQHFSKFTFGAVYDFLRHGEAGMTDDSVDLVPEINQWLMFDGITSFQALFGGSTAFMRTFDAYYALRPSSVHAHIREHAAKFLPKGVSIEKASRLNRMEFFAKYSEMFAAEIKAGR
ncbi:MAG TPA: hypothetical protein VEP30_11650 [Chthoniobacterales bacterium]|nr:hypothetical protein [Chthoniobacterales bacterium]